MRREREGKTSRDKNLINQQRHNRRPVTSGVSETQLVFIAYPSHGITVGTISNEKGAGGGSEKDMLRQLMDRLD